MANFLIRKLVQALLATMIKGHRKVLCSPESVPLMSSAEVPQSCFEHQCNGMCLLKSIGLILKPHKRSLNMSKNVVVCPLI